MINTLTSFGRSLSARFSLSRFAASLDAGLGRIPFVLQTIWVLLLASFLSLWRLGAADLWVDEAISYWIARKPLLELLTYSLSRAWEHPPVYYVLLRLWMGLLGDSEFALRAFSWFGMVLAVTAIATLARRWFGDRIALAAALIAATNPMMVKHARDARMYIWLMALVVLSVYAFDRALLRNRWRDWALFLGVLALAVGMHYLIALVFLCYAIFLVMRWRRLPSTSRARFTWILVSLLVLGIAEFSLLSGPRASLVEGINLFLQTPRTLAPLWSVYREWALGNSAQTLPLFVVAPLTFFFWALVAVGIVGFNRLPSPHPAGSELAAHLVDRRTTGDRGACDAVFGGPAHFGDDRHGPVGRDVGRRHLVPACALAGRRGVGGVVNRESGAVGASHRLDSAPVCHGDGLYQRTGACR